MDPKEELSRMTEIVNCSGKNMKAVRLKERWKRSDAEFWAVVGPDKDPIRPFAGSRSEFELKLAVDGLKLDGEIDWTDVGLPLTLRWEYDISAFEIGKERAKG